MCPTRHVEDQEVIQHFPWTKGPGIGDEVASEVVRFHERLVVEVGDYNVLDIATNIEHLKKDQN